LRKAENDVVQVQSVKNSNDYWSTQWALSMITALVAAIDVKAFNLTELLKSYLAGGNRIINCHRQTNRNRHNWNIWQNTWPKFFIRITSVFSYLC